MRFQTEREKAIKAALYSIAISSKQAQKPVWTDMDGRVRTASTLSFQWRTVEQDLLWAIYARAVYDETGIMMRFMGKDVTPIPNETARSGLITLPSGKRVNILELLGIDEPEWAWRQIERAVSYETMPDGASDSHKKMAA